MIHSKLEVDMAYPASPYIQERDGALYIAGTRVSLDTVVIRFEEGASPERILRSFPTLKRANVYGAIAYYLDNEELGKAYIAQGQRELERTVPPLSQSNPGLFARLQTTKPNLMRT
ncbi:MAG: DUF433 domain-containing protein [Acidobacteria bacterium]|nr:DUF433 domain-containing protein [Acidobacteriota bacterium]